MKFTQSIILIPLLLLLATLTSALPMSQSKHISKRTVAIAEENVPSPRSFPSIFTRRSVEEGNRYVKEDALEERGLGLLPLPFKVPSLVGRFLGASAFKLLKKQFLHKRSLLESEELYNRSFEEQLQARYLKEDSLETRGIKDFFKKLLGGIKTVGKGLIGM